MLKLKHKYLLGIAIVGVNLAAVTLPVIANATPSDTTILNLSVNEDIYANSTDGTVTIGAINPTPTGQQSIAKDTVSASTNDPLGLTIQLAENDPSLTGMIDGVNTIPTSAGTTGTPVIEAGDTWGWRVDSLAGFGAGPSGVVTSVNPSATLTFAAIPANASPFTIGSSSSTGAKSVDVYYGANVTTSQAIGPYSTTVVYTYITN